jgi:peptidoglycan/LPS O-acetylase OafA/YrhL
VRRHENVGFLTDVGWSSSRVTIEVDLAGPTNYAAGKVTVELQASSDGLLLAAPWLSLMIAVLLMIGKGHLGHIEAGKEAGPAGELLIALPALLAVAIVRSDEHPLVTCMLRGIRAATILVGLASIVAAASLTHPFDDHTDHGIWSGGARAASVLTALLFVCLAVNWSRRRGRPPDEALLR